MSEEELSVFNPDPCVDTNAAFKWGGTELLKQRGKIDMEQVVEGQEHCTIQSRYYSGFFVLRNQVLVPS